MTVTSLQLHNNNNYLGIYSINSDLAFHTESLLSMELELLWSRPNAPSVALRGGLRLLRLAEFVRYNRAAIGGPSKWQLMSSLPKLSHKPPK